MNLFGIWFILLIIELYFLILTVILQIFNLTVELTTSAGTPTNEENVEIETQPVTAEIKTRKFSK